MHNTHNLVIAVLDTAIHGLSKNKVDYPVKPGNDRKRELSLSGLTRQSIDSTSSMSPRTSIGGCGMTRKKIVIVALPLCNNLLQSH